MVKVRYTIEPRWTTNYYKSEIEIGDTELEGLTPAERERAIQEVVADAVNNDCPWGWEEEEAPE